MKIIETGPREIGFVLWGHCQNLLNDPRIRNELAHFFLIFLSAVFMIIGAIIYAAKVKIEGMDLHAGFALCIVAGVLAIVAGILYLIYKKND